MRILVVSKDKFSNHDIAEPHCKLKMGNTDIVAFGVWSVITVVILIVISLVYRQRRKKNEPSSH